ncbi:hypothetical protein SAMD00023353_9700080 [Rosellinia necatrix]|uniref:Secreted protein n=1 Tax=Rosellinia necatrix TaxID=77044 RepID=A0A1S8AB45_ROSNE|nr:hypothetical protein SAMD00023353_9700080 [Rosellinia necatrix]
MMLLVLDLLRLRCTLTLHPLTPTRPSRQRVLERLLGIREWWAPFSTTVSVRHALTLLARPCPLVFAYPQSFAPRPGATDGPSLGDAAAASGSGWRFRVAYHQPRLSSRPIS